MSDTNRVQPTFDAPAANRATPPRLVPADAPVPPLPAAANSSPRPAARIFASDAAGRATLYPSLGRLAELAAHRGAETPFTIGLLGAPGSGKTSALHALTDSVADLSRASSPAGGPFLPNIAIIAVDAAELRNAPEQRLAERLHAGLSKAAPALALAASEDASHASSDPHAVVRSIGESLDEARRRLDAERKARDEVESRRARLVESVLYESAGSRVEAYARANRGQIESALTTFGFSGDALATYKSLVHTTADAGGPANRWLASLRSLWAYKGQTRLIVFAVLLFALAWGFGLAFESRGWIDSLQSAGDTAKPLATWVSAHIDWLLTARTISETLAFLCLALLVWRAFRFSRPLLRGASLLDSDIALRRGELDNLIAHHAQRVEVLSGDADTLSRRAAEAERRAGGARPLSASPAFLIDGGPGQSVRAYIDSIADRLAAGAANAPGRIVVALDNLDRLPAADARDVLERVTQALARPAFVLLAAFNPEQFASDGDMPMLQRLVQVPFHVDASAAASDAGDVASRELASRFASSSAKAAEVQKRDPKNSALDLPLAETEQQLLTALAPLAGPSPRRVKRFVNLYRIARHDASGDLAAFALVLALSIGGTRDEIAGFDQALQTGEGNMPLRRDGLGPRVAAALDAVVPLQGHSLSAGEARRARDIVDRWSI